MKKLVFLFLVLLLIGINFVSACTIYPSINIDNKCTISFSYDDYVNPEAISWILEQNKINCSISSNDISMIRDFILNNDEFVKRQSSQEYVTFVEEVAKQNGKKECGWYYKNFSNNNGWTGYLTAQKSKNESGDKCIISAPNSCGIAPTLVYLPIIEKNNYTSCNSDSDCKVHSCSTICVNNNFITPEGVGCAYPPNMLPKNCICQNKKCIGSDEQKVGNDKDSHGCIGSAGYSWCEEKQKCLRVWEENCSDNKEDIFCGESSNLECKTDSDCKIDGCSGQVCTGVNDTITRGAACVWQDCYNHGNYNCGCKNNACQWIKNKSDFKLPVNLKIKILPETASQRARERLGELGFNITLKEVGNNNTFIYQADGEKEVKLFGFIKTNAKISAEIDTETGDIINIKRPWWAFLASGF